jgi:broad specificity phosphatase PhoE
MPSPAATAGRRDRHDGRVNAAELILVRHAEADGSDLGDPGLSVLGRRQATALGARLARERVAGILHSPRLRATETATIAAGDLPGALAEPSELLNDRTPVPSTGRRDEYPSRYHAWLDETSSDERDVDAVALTQALHDLVDEALRRADDGGLVLVTHAFVIGWFVRAVLDAPTWRWMRLHPANSSLSVLRFDAGHDGTLVSFNDRAHVPE